jgi:hypothetical protein
MTDQTPPPSDTPPPPPAEQPPSWAPPPTQTQAPSQWTPPAPQNVPGAGWSPYAPPRPTNSLAIVSLVAGCAQFVFCPIIGAITAIITGHIARAQIRRKGEQGNGLAVAGLILGYIGIALTVLAVAGLLVFIFGFSDDVAQHVVRDDAKKFGRTLAATASREGETPRTPAVIREVYQQEHVFDGCCNEDDIQLPDGTPVQLASEADWERVGWRLEFGRTIFQTEHACLTVPERQGEPALVVDGRCPG